MRRDRDQKKLVLRLGPGKCLHYYFYLLHEQLGLLHLRLQTWFPFAIHACVNGRHWLARQLDQAGIGYVQRENCFTWMEDVAKAQALARAQLQSRWPILLQPLVEQCHPHAGALCQPLALSYYWSVTESEYATDVMFKSPAALARLYPALVHQGIQHFGSTDVLRFLGHKTQANGRVHGNHQGEILSSLKHRPEGLRLKHQANGNSIKLYDKQGSVLRVETTLNRPHQFRVYRASERDPEEPETLAGVAQGHRRPAPASRDLRSDQWALFGSPGQRARRTERGRVGAHGVPARPTGRSALSWAQPVVGTGRGAAGGHQPGRMDPERLPQSGRAHGAVSRPRPMRLEQRRHSGRVTRALARLRAHGIIKKVSGSYRYQLTRQGRQIVTALLAARQADVEKLMALAA